MRFLDSLFGKRQSAFNSKDYWQARYAEGGTSGAGSYGRLADYKAKIVNGIVKDRAVSTVIEFGSGDGNQASLLDIDTYIGIDISDSVVASCRARFVQRPKWRFLTDAEFDLRPIQAELTLSQDVIYHLVEDQVFESYMHNLIRATSRYMLIFSSDHDAVTKAPHVRHRAYSEWIGANAPEFVCLEAFSHPFPMQQGSNAKETSFAHFKLFEKPAGTGK
ncbi:MAG: hypothetical protein JXR75_02355 [Rhodobacteraceae bacterium]|nr:hypothetical protein [Paracoccaceae bacterium]